MVGFRCFSAYINCFVHEVPGTFFQDSLRVVHPRRLNHYDTMKLEQIENSSSLNKRCGQLQLRLESKVEVVSATAAPRSLPDSPDSSGILLLITASRIMEDKLLL